MYRVAVATGGIEVDQTFDSITPPGYVAVCRLPRLLCRYHRHTDVTRIARARKGSRFPRMLTNKLKG